MGNIIIANADLPTETRSDIFILILLTAEIRNDRKK